jgi:hypothetical protein
VAQLQRQLKYGYEAYAGHLVIDGIVGPATAAALNLRLASLAQLLLLADNETD